MTVPGCQNGNCVYAATQDGLWFTANGDANNPTWTDLTPPAPLFTGRRISAVFAFSPIGTVYIGTSAGTSSDGVFKSIDGGATWSPTTFPRRAVNALGAARSSSNTLYAAYASGDFYMTTNGGANQVPLSGPQAGYPMATVAIVPGTNDSTVYTGTVCQSGIFKGSSAAWTQMVRDTGQHPHFHYVMRVVQHPSNSNIAYATDSDNVYCTQTGGLDQNGLPTAWQNKFGVDVHLHGLALAPSNPSLVYVGNGHGNWGSDTSRLRIWRAVNGGANPTDWTEITANFPYQANVAGCTATNPQPCTSMISIAVSPRDLNGNLDPNGSVVFVGTFGSENYPDDTTKGTGRGVVRGVSNDGGTTWNWQPINAGLSANTLSQWVGSVAIDNSTPKPNVYIATMDGLYTMPIDGMSWIDISPLCGPNQNCRRFESVAVHPTNPGRIYVGTSDIPGVSSTIYQGTFVNGNWSWTAMNPSPAPLAWSDRYRVRDIQVGQTKAYAVIEGGGIYCLSSP